MKRALAIFLAALMLLSLAACGDSSSPDSSAKEEALAFDKLLMDKMDAALDLIDTLNDAVTEVSDGSAPDALDELASSLRAIQDSLDEIETETSAGTLYVGAVRAYVANARVVAETTAAYLESGSEEDLEKFEHYTGLYSDLLDNVTEKRAAFLDANGLTS